jgi:hypothetical protein
MSFKKPALASLVLSLAICVSAAKETVTRFEAAVKDKEGPGFMRPRTVIVFGATRNSERPP